MVVHRVAWWETATAFLVYAAITVLGIVSVPAVLIWKRVRRRRRRTGAR